MTSVLREVKSKPAQFGVGYRNRVIIVTVDVEDMEKIQQYKWCHDLRKGDILTCKKVDGKTQTIRLHRLIMNAPPGMQVDHIDGNRLNNRKSNLRICTNQQNAHNKGKQCKSEGVWTSDYLGVCKSGDGRWIAKVAREFRKVYETAEDAALARDYYLRRSKYAEFAQYNYPRRDVDPEPSKRIASTGRKHISYIEKAGRYHVQLRHGDKKIGTTASTIEAAVIRRNEILRELGKPIPD